MALEMELREAHAMADVAHGLDAVDFLQCDPG